jgi:hypothetical protein
MSLETVQKLSIPDLFRVLDEKLRIEYLGPRETPLSPASLESQVYTPVILQGALGKLKVQL